MLHSQRQKWSNSFLCFIGFLRQNGSQGGYIYPYRVTQNRNLQVAYWKRCKGRSSLRLYLLYSCWECTAVVQKTTSGFLCRDEGDTTEVWKWRVRCIGYRKHFCTNFLYFLLLICLWNQRSGALLLGRCRGFVKSYLSDSYCRCRCPCISCIWQEQDASFFFQAKCSCRRCKMFKLACPWHFYI